MAIIKPLRGLRYNPDRISFISRVISPPYDVISDKAEQLLLEKDPYNFIRIEMGSTPPEGRPDDEYLLVSDIFGKWCRDGVLIREDVPSMYVMEQCFRMNGTEVKRCGFFAALLLEEPGSGSVHAHERTMQAPKTDRIRLMETCHASLSQPMMMYSDPEGEINDAVLNVCRRPDFIYSFRDDQGVGHTVWKVDDMRIINKLAALMKPQAAVIADGHHRYESALAFAEAHRPAEALPGSVPEDYIAVFMISIRDSGLISIPTHRGVEVPESFDRREFLRALKQVFSVKTAKVRNGDVVYREYNQMRDNKPHIGCITKDGDLLMLEVKDAAEQPWETACRAAGLEPLPVSILHNYILPAFLGIEPGSESESDNVEYSSSAPDIYWGVQSGRFDIGFLLPHTPPLLIHKLARNGQRLPAKSSYFYPKVPSGIIIYPHQE